VEFGEYARRFEEHARFAEVSQYGQVVESGKTYPLLKLTVPGTPELLVTSGFHGEEPAGPLTLLRHMESIVAEARRLGVGLRVHPCVNPSGFERGVRYNASGESPNNDFLRYEIAPGVWMDELAPGDTFHRWRVFEDGPQETRALRADLELGATPLAALDLHQDNYLHWPCCYAYVFGERAFYQPMLDASAAHVAVAQNSKVDRGIHTDAHGLVELRDGSVSDYMDRRGARYVAALETTTRTPAEAADAVNLVWIRGFLELAARG
jgi:hypothetical protein